MPSNNSSIKFPVGTYRIHCGSLHAFSELDSSVDIFALTRKILAPREVIMISSMNHWGKKFRTYFMRKTYASATSLGPATCLTSSFSVTFVSIFSCAVWSRKEIKNYQLGVSTVGRPKERNLTSVLAYPGQTLLTRIGARSTARPQATDSTAPARPMPSIHPCVASLRRILS